MKYNSHSIPTGWARNPDIDGCWDDPRGIVHARLPQFSPTYWLTAKEHHRPSVPRGGRRLFWCAVTSSYAPGKLFYRFLEYLNQHVMPLCDHQDEPPEGVVPVDPEDPEDYIWSGWFQSSCDYCDTQWTFTEGEVVAWMELPRDLQLEEGEDDEDVGEPITHEEFETDRKASESREDRLIQEAREAYRRTAEPEDVQ